MKNLYVFIIIVVLIVVFVYIYNKRRAPAPAYVALLRDDLYFYPPRFPVPRPQLRHHEVPHRRHFKN
jgi:hypothetical protein